jgi:hypothetical protein
MGGEERGERREESGERRARKTEEMGQRGEQYKAEPHCCADFDYCAIKVAGHAARRRRLRQTRNPARCLARELAIFVTVMPACLLCFFCDLARERVLPKCRPDGGTERGTDEIVTGCPNQMEHAWPISYGAKHSRGFGPGRKLVRDPSSAGMLSSGDQ